MEEQQKLAVWSLVDAFNNTQIRPIRTQQVSYIREFSSFIRSKYSMRKILSKIFWSHGTPLGSMGSLIQKDAPEIFLDIVFPNP